MSEAPARRGRRIAASVAGTARGGGVTSSTVAAGAGQRALDAIWLDVLQRIAARAAHELKGALNGASVNLEVVRSRAEASDRGQAAGGGGGGGGGGVSKYATAAATQLEAVIAMTDALLALSRVGRAAAPDGTLGEDAVLMLRRMVALIAPALRIDQRTLMIVEPAGSVNVSGSPVSAVRAVVGAALLAGTEHWNHTRCVVDARLNRVVLERRDGALAGEEAGAVRLEQEILDAAADAGIQVQVDGSAISMTFPMPGAIAAQTSPRGMPS